MARNSVVIGKPDLDMTIEDVVALCFVSTPTVAATPSTDTGDLPDYTREMIADANDDPAF